MDKLRLETISDGLFSIIITVMLLEFKVPQSAELSALIDQLHLIFSYILSFIYIGIYWNNHHHLFKVVKQINGTLLWVNLHLMFWLTMVPFSTTWMASSGYAAIPTATYAFILFMCSLSYRFLERMIVRFEGEHSVASKLLDNDLKLFFSMILYGVSIFLSFVNTSLTVITLMILAALWFKPNPKVEKYFLKLKIKQ